MSVASRVNTQAARIPIDNDSLGIGFRQIKKLKEEDLGHHPIRIRLGHESLDVTLAYLKGKDAESEEAQEHASSSLALYA